MENIVRKYQKHQQRRKNSTVVVSALILAAGMNAFLFSPFGQGLQASIGDAVTVRQENPGDIYLAVAAKNPEILEIRAGSKIVNATEIAFTLGANPEEVEVKNLLPSDIAAGEFVRLTEHSPYAYTLRLAKKTTILPGQVIATVLTQKKKQSSTPVTLNSTYFKEDTKTFELTNAGIDL